MPPRIKKPSANLGRSDCRTPSYTTPGTRASPGELVKSRRSDERMVRLLAIARATRGENTGVGRKVKAPICRVEWSLWSEVTQDLGEPDADQRRPESEIANASQRMERDRKARRATWGLDASRTLTIASPTRWLDARHAGSVVSGMIAGL
jgi:hypothetical protein